ncbi:alpha/beta fold hydrolase [Bradyrhizobium sp. CB2312]|uniref:alpha/beta hydrolase n=1 Tax=Bradyrhizobium sp. CB2312 TaxID=3039155 RepID=UPI0024B07D5C|nr:alpha/beta fold hydrolase [Bradyrhizobium sp. CB2312]WFU75566.1 alpha/beta fold hydrolase [Bradyrhizobium sp. CB2312]
MTPVARSRGSKTLQVYVATTRERDKSWANVFTANVANSLNFARFAVSVPPNHKPGEIEMPTNVPDPQSSFAVVDQALISEADFLRALALQGDTRRKRHKVFVFVHGFNNSFQESLFRLTQLQADAEIDGIPILFSWPSQGQVTAYEADKEAASYSHRHLMTLLTMLSSSPEVSDILLVAHSMGAMLTVDALRELRAQGMNRVMARLGGVVLAAPDIDARAFRDQVVAIGPLKPPLLVLVSKDDGALRASSAINGGVLRAGAINVEDPVVQEAAIKAKVQVVDISRLALHDNLGHDQFISVAVLYSRFRHLTSPYRNSPGTFSFGDDAGPVVGPVDVRALATAQ